LPIGIEGFSALVENLEKYQEEDGVIFTDSLIKHDIFETEPEFRDIDSERLFLYGDYDTEKLHKSLREIESFPFFIKRDIVTTCLDNIKSKNNILIIGDLGNGKSIILEMLAYELT
jgi:ATP-dependent Clp protease ATP-binding subunit ClpA